MFDVSPFQFAQVIRKKQDFEEAFKEVSDQLHKLATRLVQVKKQLLREHCKKNDAEYRVPNTLTCWLHIDRVEITVMESGIHVDCWQNGRYGDRDEVVHTFSLTEECLQADFIQQESERFIQEINHKIDLERRKHRQTQRERAAMLRKDLERIEKDLEENKP